MTNMHGHWVWFKLSSLHICHWPPYKELQKSLGLGICVIDQSQWQICIATECDLNSVACIFVIDHSQWQICIEHWVWFKLSSLHICHWPPYKELQKSLGLGIFVIDCSQWQICMATECDLNSVACIFVIDRPIRNCKKAWVSAYVSLTKVNDKYALNTECDLNSVASIFVIDHSQWQICIATECDLN